MSTALQPAQQAEGKLSEWVKKPEVYSQLSAAVGPTMPPDTFIAHAMVAFQDNTVRGCSPRSQLVALMEMAALGLLPSLNQCKLIRYGSDIKVMPQWQGFKAVMERNPDILEVECFLVHNNDRFIFQNGIPVHVFDPFDSNRTIASGKDIKGGYAKITYRDGRPPKYHFVTVNHIEKCRKCAQTQNVWTAWYEQMALKTVYRDTYARRKVPVDTLCSARMERILAADDAALGNDPRRIQQEPAPSRIGAVVHAEPVDETPLDDAPDHLTDDAPQESDQHTDSAPEPADGIVERMAWYQEQVAILDAIGDLSALAKQAGSDPALDDAARGAVLDAITKAQAAIRQKRGAKSNLPGMN